MTKTFDTRPEERRPAEHTVRFTETELIAILRKHMEQFGPVPDGTAYISGLDDRDYDRKPYVSLTIRER